MNEELPQALESTTPPLPEEDLPPLPDEELPAAPASLHPAIDSTSPPSGIEDGRGADGWQAIFDPSSKAFYFYNHLTEETTWENPRERAGASSGSTSADHMTRAEADQQHVSQNTASSSSSQTLDLAVKARFDRVTGRFVADPNRSVANYTTEARADRQMSHYFDASKTEDTGTSLKAERRLQKHSKKELAAFRLKQKEKKEHRRRAWLTED